MFEIEVEFESHKVDSPAIQIKIDAAIIAFLEDAGDFVIGSFQRHVPVGDTGRLHAAIQKNRVEKSPAGFSIDVGIGEIPPSKPGESPRYSLFVDEGTGLFGPRGRIIKPTHGNVMVFHVAEVRGFAANRHGLFSDEPGGTIITRWVEGQKGQHFSQMVDAETKAYVKIKKKELAKVIAKIIAKGI